MNCSSRTGRALLLCSAFLLAQNAPSSADKKVEAPPSPSEGVEVFSDTMGFDFGPYLVKVKQRVRANWMQLLPPSVYSPTWKQGTVSLEFAIHKDGEVSGMRIIRTGSGDVALDRAAWGSITASIPFPPLPEEFPGQILGLRFNYYYNFTPPPRIVQVLAGSSHQFSDTPEGAPKNSVAWSVVGPGCSGLACGDISGSGLYTAPFKIPDPPTVTVIARSLNDARRTVSTTVTIVQVDPSR
jgi:TonB family protein